MNKEKALNIFYIFILLQPLLDLITSLQTKFLHFPITLGIIVRGLLFIAGIVYIFFFSKSKYRKKTIIYFIILFVYSLLYFITKTDMFSNKSFLLKEIIYMFKYYYFLVIFPFLLIFFDEFKPNNRKIFKALQIVFCSYCFVIMIANITGTAFGTYVGGKGNTGWFFSGNEIGIIVAILYTLPFLLINKALSYKWLIYIFPIVLAVEIIGTKTSMMGLLLPTSFFLGYYLIRIKDGKTKQFVMTLSMLLLIFASSSNLPVITNIKNSMIRYDTRQVNKKNHKELEEYSDDMLVSVIFSDRDLFKKNIKKIYCNSPIKDKLFGIGFVNRSSINNKKINKLIEMDYYEILYRYGIVGFTIYMMPIVWFVITVLLLAIKIKFRFNMKQLVLGYMSSIGLCIAFLVGHTLGAPAVSGYLSISMVMLIYYLENGYYKIKLNDNKISILALHLGTGGIEKYLSSLCKMLENDYEIELISTYKVSDKPAFNFSDKIKIKYLIDDYPHKKEFKESLKSLNPLKTIKYGFHLFKILWLKYYRNMMYIGEINSKYIISTRTFHNRLVSSDKNRGVIAIATEHNYHNNDKKYIKNLCDSCVNIDYLVLVSEELCDFYKELLTNTKSIYIPNVIDNIPPQRKITKTNNKLITIGRLEKEKGYEDLIDIINIVKEDIPKVKLDVYGDGTLRNELSQKIDELDLKENEKL